MKGFLLALLRNRRVDTGTIKVIEREKRFLSWSLDFLFDALIGSGWRNTGHSPCWYSFPFFHSIGESIGLFLRDFCCYTNKEDATASAGDACNALHNITESFDAMQFYKNETFEIIELYRLRPSRKHLPVHWPTVSSRPLMKELSLFAGVTSEISHQNATAVW